MKEIDKVDRQIARLIQTTLQQAQWEADWQRCQQVEGIGPITAAALTMAYKRGPFKDSDAFVAFIGMDVRVRDSGQKQGKRKLTKQGDPELRRLLYLAAMQAKRQPAWQGFYQRYIERGMAKVQALTILARKLARVAFALLHNQSEYDPQRRLLTLASMPCSSQVTGRGEAVGRQCRTKPCFAVDKRHRISYRKRKRPEPASTTLAPASVSDLRRCAYAPGCQSRDIQN